MTRQPNVIRPIKLTTTLPEDVRAKLDLHLYSEAEGRVPKGAIQAFLIERIREYFAGKEGTTIPPPAKRIVKLCLEAMMKETPQEWWVDNFANPQDAYLWAKDFIKVL